VPIKKQKAPRNISKTRLPQNISPSNIGKADRLTRNQALCVIVLCFKSITTNVIKVKLKNKNQSLNAIEPSKTRLENRKNILCILLVVSISGKMDPRIAHKKHPTI
jgi:hypothetical protein